MTPDVPDPDRPKYHFTASSGWINDPLGLSHHDGAYHLFFQQVPGALTWQTEQHWGHATSPDLLRWTEHEPVLSPGDGDEGVWSGSIVAPDDAPTVLFYTSVSGSEHHVGQVRVARPLDSSWRTWTKGGVVARLPDGLRAVTFRDPFVVHDGTSWLMLIGAGLTDGTATALAYRSHDLERWTYDGPLVSRHRSSHEPLWTGAAWECPQLIRVDGRWVLVVSVWEPGAAHDEAYAVGDLVDGRFVPETWHRLSAGRCHYAGSAFTDADDRPGLIHWLRGLADVHGRWAGAHSVPHLVGVRGDRLVARPHPNLDAARTGATPVRNATRIGSAGDLEWTVTPGRPARLLVTDGQGVIADLTSDGATITVLGGCEPGQIPLLGADVRVLLDGPVLEVFTDGGILGAQIRAPGPGTTVSATGSGFAVVHGLT